MFKSQSSRFVDPKHSQTSRNHFQAEIKSSNIYVSDGQSIKKSRNKTQILTSPVKFSSQTVGFCAQSPRFEQKIEDGKNTSLHDLPL